MLQGAKKGSRQRKQHQESHTISPLRTLRRQQNESGQRMTWMRMREGEETHLGGLEASRLSGAWAAA